jgi:hypothetical protein
MSYTAKKLLAIAEAEVGYLEKESNYNLDSKTGNAGDENYTKYARDLYKAGYYNGNKQGYAYCDVFHDWCHWKAAGENKKEAERVTCQTGDLGAGCTYSADYFQAAGRFYSSPKVGDQIFFGDDDDEYHTGIVYKVDSSRVYTIEGNTSGASGVVDNGGGVFKKSYALNYYNISGYGRPRYDEETTPDVNPKDPVIKENEASKLVVDGQWGKATTTRLQQIFGTPVDGEVSNQWMAYKASNPGLMSGWDWKIKPNRNGSELIMAMQKWAGMSVGECDGEIGPATIKAFQKKLGTVQDGKVSNPSQMVKALQKWANEQ